MMSNFPVEKAVENFVKNSQTEKAIVIMQKHSRINPKTFCTKKNIRNILPEHATKSFPINEHKNFNLRNWPHGTCKAMTIRVKCQEQKTVQFNIVLHLLNKVASAWHSLNNFQTGTETWVNNEWRILTRSGAEEKTLRISHCFNLYLSFGTFVLNDLFYRPTRLSVLG